VPWTSPNVSLYIGNNLRKPNRFVGLHIAIPATATHSLFRHAITVWGDNGENASSIALNPSSIVVADSDYNRDNVGTNGPLQSYTYLQSDHSFHPWTLNYHGRQPVIEGVVILQRVREKPNTGVPGGTMIIDSSGLATGASLDPATIRSVVGSYRLRQHGLANAIGLHYYTSSDSVVYLPDDDPEWKHTRINQSTDFHGFIGDNHYDSASADFYSYPVPLGSDLTITTEYNLGTSASEPTPLPPSMRHFGHVLRGWANGGEYGQVTYPELGLKVVTPEAPDVSAANITGGYVIGAFDVLDSAGTFVGKYRLQTEYTWDQDPELHNFELFPIGDTTSFRIENLKFGHSYGFLDDDELWDFNNWTTSNAAQQLVTQSNPLVVPINWDGLLPYPPGTNFTIYDLAAAHGDFNADGAVDAADYVVWRKGFGTTYTQDDYNIWRANFGLTSGSSGASGVSAGAAVPEPGDFCLAVAALAAVFAGRGGRRSSTRAS
jgi:hypothetical protein